MRIYWPDGLTMLFPLTQSIEFMHINLHVAVLNVKLLLYCFNSNLALNLNFEIESANKSVLDFNVDCLSQ